MYEVQNFLSATSIFVEKFLLNIFAAAEGILCQKFVNSSHFKLYHPKVFFLLQKLKHSENTSIVLFEEMQTWNCIWELAEEGKIKEKVKYRGTHPCFRDCCKNPSDENRATAKIPKKVVQMKPRKCECTPHIWEQRRWMTTSKEWWCDIFLAKQWFWRGFHDFRKWQFE